ncbi:hypothetical protein L7F22_018639 [Adiantum nelumboides]|nr:hypothetical protein [Adiantum nelumboides]
MIRNESSIWLLQKKYGLDMFMKYAMADFKLIFTPLDQNLKLKIDEGEVLDNATMYPRIVDSIIYKAISRPVHNSAISNQQEDTVEGAKPVRQKLRRMGKEQMNALKEEVDKLLNAGFIVPVDNTEWVSPVVVTPKEDGRWRVCIDYKPLNAVTKKDPYPLPFIDQLLDAVAGFERYSVCDGYSGYFQLILAPEDRKKTTFITPWGCFCFCCLPFGLTNGPGAFERKVDWVFNPFLGKFVKGFIDDFCVYSSRKEHVQKLEMTFARYDECEGQLNPKKCHLAQPRVKLLGHVIFENGIEADPEKVEALLLLSSPKDTRQLATFIQKVKYLSRFIHLASQLLYPLQQAVKKDPLEWTYYTAERGNMFYGYMLLIEAS